MKHKFQYVLRKSTVFCYKYEANFAYVYFSLYAKHVSIQRYISAIQQYSLAHINWSKLLKNAINVILNRIISISWSQAEIKLHYIDFHLEMTVSTELLSSFHYMCHEKSAS